MKPRIFISSTFYDLKYIREDLSNFVDAHDFEPIMFENGDIGYIPGKPLDESCYDAMRTADMVLLIIGGQYGSPSSNDKEGFNEYMSVTRNEFQTALSNGIPIYSFVDSSVLSEFNIYELNFTKIEDKSTSIVFSATKNINVFRFIKYIKTIGNIPMIEFKKSNEIKEFMSKQWSDMFKNYLNYLKEKRKSDQLYSTMSEMQKLVSKMDIMLDGIGKKILNVDEEGRNQLNNINTKKEIIDACFSIANNLEFRNIGSLLEAEKEDFINNLLDVINNTNWDEIYENLGSEDEGRRKKVFKIFEGAGLELISIVHSFCMKAKEIKRLLQVKYKRDLIVKQLIEDEYFYRMKPAK